MADTLESTTLEPEPAGPVRAPALGPVGMLRWAWRQLTSMRTALILLFLLALASVPGSLLPQRGVNPIAVSDYRAAHPTAAPWLDRFGFFDVYASPWFAATYLLLFVSLVGCVLPRTGLHWRAMRGQPPAAPRNLSRLPVARSFETTEAPESVLARAAGSLRGSRFRVVEGDAWVASEKGYLRETGNLVFHLSLIVLLLGVAWGSLGGVKGVALVVEGEGFANTVTQYDQITPGRAYDVGSLAPFSFTLDDFRATYEAGPVQTGAARTFEADLTVTDEPGATPRTVTVQVNKPLRGRRVQGVPRRPRLCADLHGEGRARPRRLRPAGGVPAAGRQLLLAVRDQGAGRPPDAAGLRRLVLPDGDRRRRTAVVLPGRREPRGLPQRLDRRPRPRRRRRPVGLRAGHRDPPAHQGQGHRQRPARRPDEAGRDLHAARRAGDASRSPGSRSGRRSRSPTTRARSSRWSVPSRRSPGC